MLILFSVKQAGHQPIKKIDHRFKARGVSSPTDSSTQKCSLTVCPGSYSYVPNPNHSLSSLLQHNVTALIPSCPPKEGWSILCLVQPSHNVISATKNGSRFVILKHSVFDDQRGETTGSPDSFCFAEVTLWRNHVNLVLWRTITYASRPDQDFATGDREVECIYP